MGGESFEGGEFAVGEFDVHPEEEAEHGEEGGDEGVDRLKSDWRRLERLVRVSLRVTKTGGDWVTGEAGATLMVCERCTRPGGARGPPGMLGVVVI